MLGRHSRRGAGTPRIERSPGDQREQIAAGIVEENDKISVLRAAKKRADPHTLPGLWHRRSHDSIFLVGIRKARFDAHLASDFAAVERAHGLFDAAEKAIHLGRFGK